MDATKLPWSQTRRLTRSAVVACALALAASGCTTTSSPARTASSPTQPNPAAATTKPVTSTPATSAKSGRVTKVLVFIEENHSLSEMTSGMPYTFQLAKRYGYATGYSAIRHPSLPNYVAIAGGQTYGITNDGPPAAHPLNGASVFGQAVAAEKTAAVYAEDMPQPCATSNAGSSYAVRHNPWTYFINERGTCQIYDLPIDRLSGAITNGALPNVGMVIPNLCNDAHNCGLATADTWFKGWMTKIFESPDWKSGHLAVVVTADEDDTSAGNTVLTLVIHPSQKAHVVTTRLNHYSLTRLYEEVAGLPYLFNAASAPSMATAFGLPLS